MTTLSTGISGQPTGSAGSTASAFAAGTWVDIANGEGTTPLALTPPKSYASVYSSPKLTADSFTVSTGGTCSGTVTDYRCIDDTFYAREHLDNLPATGTVPIDNHTRPIERRVRPPEFPLTLG